MIEKIQNRCALIAQNGRFENFMLGVILINALIIGLETYPTLREDYHDILFTANEVALVLFTVEILIRITAHIKRPSEFFKSPWNVFDLLVVILSYLPLVRENATLLRLARLLRVTRLLEVIPGIRVVILGITRSLKPIGGLAALTFFLLYMYGVLGWILYHEEDPEQWGNIGIAILTLFQVLTLEGWNSVLESTMEIHSASWIYLISFVMIGTFVVLNMVIGIVINSIEEARQIEEQRQFEEQHPDAKSEGDEIRQSIRDLQKALDALERKL